MENNILIQSLNTELAINLPEKTEYDELLNLLAGYINDLIKNDFQKLVRYLYRIDVSEPKLKSLLHQNPQEDAGNIIAALIIERQEQKIKTRQYSNSNRNSQREDNFEEEEKW